MRSFFQVLALSSAIVVPIVNSTRALGQDSLPSQPRLVYGGLPYSGAGPGGAQVVSREVLDHPVFHPQIQLNLLGRPVFLSLTTSPERIQHVWQVLHSLNLALVTEVLVAIPERFARTGETYTIPAELSLMRHPPVRILREPVDLGPITKLVPAIEYAQTVSPDAIVITVDDDIAYAPGLVEEMLYQLVQNPGTVFSGSLPWVIDWGIDFADWPFAEQDAGVVVEGWSGIGYHARDVDPALLRRLAQLSPETFVSDDIVISYALGLRGVPKRRLPIKWGGTNYLLSHGFGPDALHQGAGLSPGKLREIVDVNRWKYRVALDYLNRHLCELQAI